jgi:hypothetical protein
MANDIITYGQLMDSLAGYDAFVRAFERIVSHQGPLTKKHPDYKGETYNVVVEWSNG